MAVDPSVARHRMISRRAYPLEPYPGSRGPWRCLCMNCASPISPRYDNVYNGNQGPCKWCSGKARVPDHIAEAEMIRSGARPLVPYPRVDDPWECECLHCGSVITPRLMTIRRGNRACKWCAGIEITPTAAWDYMYRLGEVEPVDRYPGVDKPWLSKCRNCSRDVTPSLHAVKNQGSRGCIYCAGNAPLDPAFAAQILRESGAEPDLSVPFPGRRKRWVARCLIPDCGLKIFPIVESVRRGSSPCPAHAAHGFNSAAPAFVYLVVEPTRRIAKIGICNAGSARIVVHSRMGWTLHEQTYFTEGWKAYAVEQSVLHRWRKIERWPVALTDAADMPQNGHTETVATAPGRTADVLWTHVQTATGLLCGIAT